jgi:polar amino acid transport system permease protein
MIFRGFGFNDFLILADGLRWTFGLTVAAFVGSFVLGTALLLLRTGPAPLLRVLAMLWIQALQGIPLLGVLFVAYFGVALFGIDVPRWLAAAVALSIYGSVFLAEIWRGAVEAVPKGQWEAAAALGLTRLATVRLVVLPQALTIAIPATAGFLVQLIKDTSLASIVGVVDLMREAQLVNSITYAPFAVYGSVAVLYFALCFPLTRWSRHLEQRRMVAR